MQKYLLRVLALTAICASLTLAQPPGGTPPTPADMVARQVARLTSLLTLTAAQQAQATTIYTNEQTALAGLRSSMQTARTALQSAVQKNDTATINAQAAQIGNLTGQSTQAQATADAAFFQILTPDQQTKFSQIHAGGPGRGFGGPGMARFGGGRQ